MASSGSPDSPTPQDDRISAPAPLSSGQRRLWFLQQLRGDSGEYHIPEAYRLHGALHPEALARALDALVARHESLRTQFLDARGQPLQQPVPPRPVDLPVEDLKACNAAEQEGRVAQVLRDEWWQPFDLTTGPLLRARLLKLTDTEHILVLTTHHIASDGWSQGILRHELGILYAAFCEGREVPLGQADIQYADYALWQRDRIESSAVSDSLKYWEDQLRGLPPLLTLPADRPRAARSDATGGICRRDVDAQVTARLRRIGASQGATLYMTTLAAFGVLLSRYSGQQAIAVGTPIANRNHVRFEGLVGLLANTLALRVSVHPDAGFGELLRDVRQTTLQAHEHQEAPFERIVEMLSPDRRLGRTPVFQVLFALQPSSKAAPDLRDLRVEPIELPDIRARFDLELHVAESQGCVTLQWVYDASLFDRSRIERMADDFDRLLEEVSRDPSARVAGLGPREVLPPAPGAAEPDQLEQPSVPAEVPAVGSSPREEVLRGLFAEVLGLPEVDRHDSFFLLGGHSLMAMSLIAKVQDLWGIELTVSDIFIAPSPAELAVHITT
ncbi:condensation domain-containing protein [Streptomyces sp. NPDC059970]|uniref:condensation domain-containing protein n=1 Tax=Streptomyces sp. NPDC059970 TaxID=3347019 RepID=UPI0036CE0808